MASLATKKRKTDDKQLSLFSFGLKRPEKTSEPAESEGTVQPESAGQSLTKPGSSESSSEAKIARSFQSKWLLSHKWLRFDEQQQLMFCNLCTEKKRDNAFTRGCCNFRTSTFADHVKCKDHQTALLATTCKEDFQQVMKKHHSAKEDAVVLALKSVYYLVSENIPLSKFKSFVDFQKSVGVSGYSPLGVSDGITYESDYAVHEFLKSLSDTVESETSKKLQESPFVTVLCDESTDRTVTHRLVVYCQIINNDMVPATIYISNIRLDEGTGQAISSALYSELAKRGITPDKIMGLGTDGASAMTGRDKGTTGMMLRQNPHLINVHCIAHRLALCTSQASDSIPAMKTYQEVLTSIFYYFKYSTARVAKFQAIQDVLDSPRLKMKEVHAVRWMSFFSALEAVYKCLDPLLTYLADTELKDAKAQGLKKKIATLKFVSMTHILMDVIPIVTTLNLFFQKEVTDVALIKVKIDQALSDLRQLIDTPGCHEKSLQEMGISTDGRSFKGHAISLCPEKELTSVKVKFISAVITNIETRFPDTDLLSSFGILSMRPISMLSEQDLKVWGNEKLETLIQHFGAEKTHTWKENKEPHSKSSPPIIDPDQTREEWAQVKTTVKAEMYPRDSIFTLWQLLAQFHRDQFPNLLKLASLAITCPVNTAGCERGFSVQNQTLTALRNRLNPDTQDQIFRIRINGKSCKEFPFDQAFEQWKAGADRRLLHH